MKEKGSVFTGSRNRRSFLKSGMVAGAATIGSTMLPASPIASAAEEDDHALITKGDIAILTFLSALEQVEADLWIQYAELGGATNQGLSPIDCTFVSTTPRDLCFLVFRDNGNLRRSSLLTVGANCLEDFLIRDFADFFSRLVQRNFREVPLARSPISNGIQ
jgi:hypothetical protein